MLLSSGKILVDCLSILRRRSLLSTLRYYTALRVDKIQRAASPGGLKLQNSYLCTQTRWSSFYWATLMPLVDPATELSCLRRMTRPRPTRAIFELHLRRYNFVYQPQCRRMQGPSTLGRPRMEPLTSALILLRYHKVLVLMSPPQPLLKMWT